MRIAIYCRVSTKEQISGQEAQERALRDFCALKGYIDVKLFSDLGISGTREQRPGLDSLLQACRSKEVDLVVVYSFSRFARSVTHLLKALNEFQCLNIGFVSLSEQLDTSTPLGKTVFVIVGALAELEASMIRERVRNGLKNAVEKGVRLGRPRTRNSEAIRQLYKQGYSQRAIAKLLNYSRNTIQRELGSVASNGAVVENVAPRKEAS